MDMFDRESLLIMTPFFCVSEYVRDYALICMKHHAVHLLELVQSLD